jgi:hypothetical protein
VVPASTPLAVALAGVALFATTASLRQQRAAPAPALLGLTVLLSVWLYGAGRVWSKQWPSMVRWTAAWTRHSGAWEWTALLALAYVSAGFAGASLRALSDRRLGRGCGYALIALAAFAGWSAVVRYAVALAVAGAAIVVISLAAVAVARRSVPPATKAAVRPAARAVAIALVTALITFSAIALLVVAVVPTGG